MINFASKKTTSKPLASATTKTSTQAIKKTSVGDSAKIPSKWLIVGALAVFLGTSFIAIFINATVLEHGFHLEYSISHYVGLELWSAIFFTLGNIFVSIFMAYFLWKLGEAWKMPRLFYWLIVVLVVSLIGLSVCPSGFADMGDQISTVTWIHVLTSRLMFIAMMLIAAMIVVCRHANALAHIINVVYLIYAVVCIMGFMEEQTWFLDAVMVFETIYLAAFMTVMAACDDKHEKLADFHADEW